ncbi:HAMP domain-containing histidine kinase [bacterium]|nr:HAMP domain-containing histidine kinase [bacterium]
MTEYNYQERVENGEIERIYNLVSQHQELVKIINDMPIWILILNQTRQAVYFNKKLKDDLGFEDEWKILGTRPGELFSCQHAWADQAGCGNSEFCKYCGAVKSIRNSHFGKKDVQECRLLINHNKQISAMDLEVSSSPLSLDSEELTLFSLLDISALNKSLYIEKTFLHDIRNTAAAIVSSTELISSEDDPEMKDQLINLLTPTAHQLIEEISVQQEIRRAELGEWEAKANKISSRKIVDDVVTTCKHYIIDEEIEITTSIDNLILNTEEVLLKRVLVNMVKNAIEASRCGDTIDLQCRNLNDVSVLFSVHNPKYIPEEIRLQLFHRSFSTKGNNRGLGTYSIKMLTENYLRGEVSVHSDKESGTLFSIIIPINNSH